MILKLKTNSKAVGAKQVKKALSSDEVEIVFIAMDAEESIINEIIQICRKEEVEIIQVESMRKLGEACCIDVNAATAALLK